MNASSQPLLDAIVAAPEDDAPRLVYADWLLASGDRLGELIVAQLELARRPDDRELERRVAQLISAHRAEVIGDLPLSKPVFRRGFVAAAEISATDFLDVGTSLFMRLPLLRELTIWLEGDDGVQLCAAPLYAHLRALTLRYGRCLPVRTLARNPTLANLASLALTDCDIGPRGCEELADSPYLGSLRALEIGSDCVEVSGARALTMAAFAADLRQLRLWKVDLSPVATVALRAFFALETLDLGFNGLDHLAVRAVAGLAPTLRSLSLRGNRLSTAAVAALSPLALTQLDLEGSRIGDAGVGELAKLELASLETLNLAGNALSVAGVHRLLELPAPRLRRLNLRRNELGRCAGLFAHKLTATRVELDEIVLLPGRSP